MREIEKPIYLKSKELGNDFWISLNEGCCVARYIPTLSIGPRRFYFSMRFRFWKKVHALHVIFGKNMAPAGRGISWNGRNLFTGKSMWQTETPV